MFVLLMCGVYTSFQKSCVYRKTSASCIDKGMAPCVPLCQRGDRHGEDTPSHPTRGLRFADKTKTWKLPFADERLTTPPPACLSLASPSKNKSRSCQRKLRATEAEGAEHI